MQRHPKHVEGGLPEDHLPSQRSDSGASSSLQDASSSPFLFAVPYLEKLAPAVALASTALDALTPAWLWLEPRVALCLSFWRQHRLNDLLPALAGLFLVFFGGYFVTLVAAVEAFRCGGYEATQRHVATLADQTRAAREASARDDSLDLDHDGVADVRRLNRRQLLSRKLLVVLRAVDPQVFSGALAGVYAGCLAVVAALRVRFARTVSLGIALGDIAQASLGPAAAPVVEKMLPKDYSKWVPVVVGYLFRLGGVSLAWVFERVVGAWHAAARGAQMFTRGFVVFLESRKIIPDVDETGPVFVGLATALAVLGFYVQASGLFMGPPFPFNVLLLPASLAEWLLVSAVGSA